MRPQPRKKRNFIVSEKYKIIMLRNPKTGSSSMQQMFDDIINDPDDVIIPAFKHHNNFNSKLRFVDAKNNYYGDMKLPLFLVHANLQDMLDNIDCINFELEENIDDYSTYVFIRDPVDRFLSACRHIRARCQLHLIFKDKFKNIIDVNDIRNHFGKLYTSFPQEYKDMCDSITMDELASTVIDLPFGVLFNMTDIVRIPQNYYYSDPRVTPMDYANYNVEINKIYDKLGIPPVQIPKVNIGESRPNDQISESTIKAILKAYEEDVDFYSELTHKT